MGLRGHEPDRAERERYPLLTSLGERGPFTFTGRPLSFLVIEARGSWLFITGAAPLRDDGDRYTATGEEYRYALEGGEAERLLAALQRDFKGRAEHVIAREFEFFNPRWPLWEYLDCLGLAYEYHRTEEEPL